MKCKQFEQIASAYLDGELSIRETQVYHAHLVSCPLCRAHLEETQQTLLIFKEISVPETPYELRGYIMTSIERRVTGDISLRQRTNEWLWRLNPKPLSYASGVVLSVIMFAVTLAGFRPIPVTAESPSLTDVSYLLASPTPIVSSDLAEFNIYNDLPNAAANSENYYELPYVNDPSSLISFSHIAYQKPGIEGMAAVIEVEKDGRSRLLNVLDEPSDPTVVEQLWWTLSKPTFQPATVEGHPVSTRIVLLVEKMDVDGAIH